MRAYDFRGYAELVELLLVVRSRLGAVVGHKHELLACHKVRSINL